MRTYDKKDFTDDAVSRFAFKEHLLFINKDNRDKASALIEKAGFKIKKSVVNNQEIHPEYLEDYAGIIETGFGNTMYRTFFKKLYEIKKEVEK